MKLANGIVNEYEWDLSGAPMARYGKYLTSLIHKRERDQVDALGNPTHVTDLTSGATETFDYDDDLHYLTAAAVDTSTPGSPYYSDSFAYEASLLGARTLFTGAKAGRTDTRNLEFSYSSGSSGFSEAVMFLQDGPTRTDMEKVVQTLDAAGRPTQWEFFENSGGWSSLAAIEFDYDEAGVLKSHVTLAPAAMTFTHDYSLLRTRATEGVGNAKTDFYYERNGELAAELGCGDSTCAWSRPLQEYIWLAGEPLAMITSSLPATGDADDTAGEVRYFHNGLLGEPRKLTDGSRNVDWEVIMHPFGRRLRDVTTIPVGFSMNLGLPGQYFVPNTDLEGMVYNWHRTYVPGMFGRYLEPDPIIGSIGGARAGQRASHIWMNISSYMYVGNNPVQYVDPTGLHRKCSRWEAARTPGSHPSKDGSWWCPDTSDYLNGDPVEAGSPLNGLDDDTQQHCIEIAKLCRQKCEHLLDQDRCDQGHPFRNCVDECKAEHGCPPGMY